MQPFAAQVEQVETSLFRSASAYSGFRSAAIRPTHRRTSRSNSSSRADVGIAMGTGTDVAIESAAVTLLHGDLAGLVRARRLGRATMRNIRLDLAWAFGYDLLGVPLAAGLLFPVFGVLLSPMVAGAAMSLSSVSVIVNSLRLRRLEL